MHRRLLSAFVALGSSAAALAADNPVPTGSGPRPAVQEEAANLPGYTLYRPKDLSDAALPVVVWGNGSCRNVGNAYPQFHAELASHGYLVIALGPIVAGYAPPSGPVPTQAAATAAPPPPTRGNNETDEEQFVKALDWATAENRRAGSPLAGHIDVEHVAATGHSCGGLQALWAGLHEPRVDTIILGNSGTIEPPVLAIDVSRAQTATLTRPALYLIGGPTDIAYANAEADFAVLTGKLVVKANRAVGHGGTYHEPNGGEFARVAVAWLDWQLKGSREAAALFTGEPCGLCTSPGWTVERRLP
jgi:dienelactone hydrolase